MSFKELKLDDIFAKNAPAKESPQPVGSTILEVGNAGSEIKPQGNLARTPEAPLLIINELGPLPKDSPPCNEVPDNMGSIA